MEHLSLSAHPQGKIKTWVEFASGAFAAGLPTGPLHADEATTEEGLLVKDLGEAGTGSSFWIGQMASGTHSITSFYSDILYYIRYPIAVKQFFECEFAQDRSLVLKLWNS
jgi:hypothetical protein